MQSTQDAVGDCGDDYLAELDRSWGEAYPADPDSRDLQLYREWQDARSGLEERRRARVQAVAERLRTATAAPVDLITDADTKFEALGIADPALVSPYAQARQEALQRRAEAMLALAARIPGDIHGIDAEQELPGIGNALANLRHLRVMPGTAEEPLLAGAETRWITLLVGLARAAEIADAEWQSWPEWGGLDGRQLAGRSDTHQAVIGLRESVLRALRRSIATVPPATSAPADAARDLEDNLALHAQVFAVVRPAWNDLAALVSSLGSERDAQWPIDADPPPRWEEPVDLRLAVFDGLKAQLAALLDELGTAVAHRTASRDQLLHQLQTQAHAELGSGPLLVYRGGFWRAWGAGLEQARSTDQWSQRYRGFLGQPPDSRGDDLQRLRRLRDHTALVAGIVEELGMDDTASSADAVRFCVQRFAELDVESEMLRRRFEEQHQAVLRRRLSAMESLAGTVADATIEAPASIGAVLGSALATMRAIAAMGVLEGGDEPGVVERAKQSWSGLALAAARLAAAAPPDWTAWPQWQGTDPDSLSTCVEGHREALDGQVRQLRSVERSAGSIPDAGQEAAATAKRARHEVDATRAAVARALKAWSALRAGNDAVRAERDEGWPVTSPPPEPVSVPEDAPAALYRSLLLERAELDASLATVVEERAAELGRDLDALQREADRLIAEAVQDGYDPSRWRAWGRRRSQAEALQEWVSTYSRNLGRPRIEPDRSRALALLRDHTKSTCALSAQLRGSSAEGGAGLITDSRRRFDGLHVEHPALRDGFLQALNGALQQRESIMVGHAESLEVRTIESLEGVPAALDEAAARFHALQAMGVVDRSQEAGIVERAAAAWARLVDSAVGRTVEGADGWVSWPQWHSADPEALTARITQFKGVLETRRRSLRGIRQACDRLPVAEGTASASVPRAEAILATAWQNVREAQRSWVATLAQCTALEELRERNWPFDRPPVRGGPTGDPSSEALRPHHGRLAGLHAQLDALIEARGEELTRRASNLQAAGKDLLGVAPSRYADRAWTVWNAELDQARTQKAWIDAARRYRNRDPLGGLELDRLAAMRTTALDVDQIVQAIAVLRAAAASPAGQDWDRLRTQHRQATRIKVDVHQEPLSADLQRAWKAAAAARMAQADTKGRDLGSSDPDHAAPEAALGASSGGRRPADAASVDDGAHPARGGGAGHQRTTGRAPGDSPASRRSNMSDAPPSPTSTGRLYWAPDPGRDGALLRSATEVLERYPSAKSAFEASGVSDAAEFLLDIMLPQDIPGQYLMASISLPRRNNPAEHRMLALRAAFPRRSTWCFPDGVALVVKAFWDLRPASAFLKVQAFAVTSDDPQRPFERAYEALPVRHERGPRPDSALTNGDAGAFPQISEETRDRLEDWFAFVAWKEKLVRLSARGLRYTSFEVVDRERGIVEFQVLAPDSETAQRSRGVIGGKDVVAFGLDASEDEWELRVANDRRRGRPFDLARIVDRTLKPTELDRVPPGCPWDNPSAFPVRVHLQDRHVDALKGCEEGELPRALARLPEEGFLGLSLAGDLALLNRHREALQDLVDQGGFAPYLSAYLFDATSSRPSLPVTVDWPASAPLNHDQRTAVERVLGSRDLCLLQGPPGTGKTTVIAEATVQLARRQQTVLIASQAHTAVDNAISRLPLDPDLRVVRLANTPDRVGEDGRTFVGSSALQRYYESLGEASREQVDRWRLAASVESRSEHWRRRAEDAVAALDSAISAEVRAEADRRDARRQLELAQQQLTSLSEEREALQHRQVQLGGFTDEVERARGGLAPGDWIPDPDLPLPPAATKRLAEGLDNLLRSTRVKAPNRSTRAPVILEMLRSWQRALAETGPLGRLADSLGSAEGGDSVLQAQIAAKEREIEHLARQLEEDPGVLPQWQDASRQRNDLLREFRQGAGGGDDRCLNIFSDAAELRSAIQQSRGGGQSARGHASQTATQISERVAALNDRRDPILQRIEEFLSALAEQRQSSTVEVADSQLRDLQRRTEVLAKHLDELDTEQQRRQTAREDCERQLAAVQDDIDDDLLPLLSPGGARPRESVREMIRDLTRLPRGVRDRAAEAAAEQQVWAEVLSEWADDLTREDRADADWDEIGHEWAASCNVVAVTCNERPASLNDIGHHSFDVAIIDEVSKSTPVELLLPLMRASRSVLVGDHRQLPPTFQEGNDAESFLDQVDDEDEDDSAMTKENIRRFEHLVTASLFKSHFEHADDSIKARLNIQYRMHPQIMDMVNHFYFGALQCGLDAPDAARAHNLSLTGAGGRTLLQPIDHALWVDTTDRTRTDRGPGHNPRTNALEARLIAETLRRLDRQLQAQGYSKKNPKPIGIVSFYADQARAIRKEINKNRPSGAVAWSVDTVIRYQGREQPIILVSLVRDVGPMRRRGRRLSSKSNVARYEFINVAFSRAQELLIVFGAKDTFESLEVELPLMDEDGVTRRPVYRDLIGELERDGRLVTAEHFQERP